MTPARATTITIQGVKLRLTNLDKVLYPQAGLTKADVIDYYARIAPAMLPHLDDRPVSLKRFPDGPAGRAFFEKNCPSHRPPWVPTSPLGATTRPINLCMVDRPATLVWLANLAALEIHAYLWTASAPHTPTLVVFDLDPGPGATIRDSARVALRLRDLLNGLGLRSIPKTSGGKGLHVCVPLNTPGATFARTKAFARAVAVALERDDPERLTSNMSKRLRPGRVFIDWSQNDRHKTTVSVYSLRGRPRPTVSAPVAWDEVERARRKPSVLALEAADVLGRLDEHGDLARELATRTQRLPEAR